MNTVDFIKHAMSKDRLLTFTYTSKNGVTKRTVEPYKINVIDNKTYLWAWCLLRNEARMFRIDNIINISQGGHFNRRSNMPEPNHMYYMNKSNSERKEEQVSSVKSNPNNMTIPVKPSAFWKLFLQNIRQVDMAAWAFLYQGEFAGISDYNFLWRPYRKEGEESLISMLNCTDKNKIICDCLHELTGENYTFTAIHYNSPYGSYDKDKENEEYLKSIYETFGKEPVEIID